MLVICVETEKSVVVRKIQSYEMMRRNLMNKEAQRIAIAEARGYINIRKSSTGGLVADTVQGWIYLKLPDFLHDLNAMHDVERGMDDALHKKYRRELRFVTGCGASTTTELELDNRKFFEATAAQRAEAYLKTIGKWVES